MVALRFSGQGLVPIKGFRQGPSSGDTCTFPVNDRLKAQDYAKDHSLVALHFSWQFSMVTRDFAKEDPWVALHFSEHDP